MAMHQNYNTNIVFVAISSLACYDGSSVCRIAYRSIKSSTCNGAKLGFYSENKFVI